MKQKQKDEMVGYGILVIACIAGFVFPDSARWILLAIGIGAVYNSLQKLKIL